MTSDQRPPAAIAAERHRRVAVLERSSTRSARRSARAVGCGTAGRVELLSPEKIAKLLRTIPIASGDPVAEQRRQVAVDLLADLRRNHAAIRQIDRQLDAALLEHGTSLASITGIGASARPPSSP